MKLPVTIDPRKHDAVIFDLDGVVTDTASIHAATWATLFDNYLARRSAHSTEDHSPFSDGDYRQFVDGKPRHDGVADFLASRGITLPTGLPSDSSGDSVCGLGNRKQQLFLGLLADGVPLFDSTVALVRKLQSVGVGTAVFSSSRNCEKVLRAAGISDLFGVRVEGVVADELGLPGKPVPPSWSKPRAGSMCVRSGLSWSKTPTSGWRQVAVQDSHSSSVSTGPDTATNYYAPAPTSSSPTWPRSRSARATNACRRYRVHWNRSA